MPKLNDETIQAALQPHRKEGESLKHWAFGLKQPSLLLIILLIFLAIIPGLIAVFLLTKSSHSK